MKWITTVIALNLGLALVCFGLMARANDCQKSLEDTFFGAGHLVLWVTAFLFLVALVSSIGTWRNRRKQVARKVADVVRRRLAVNLQAFRLARRITPADLARQAQLSEEDINDIEHGSLNIPLSKLEGLARAVGCTEEDLLRP